MFDEVKEDGLKFVLLIAGVFVIAGLFKMWTSMGMVGFLIMIAFVAFGAGGYWLWKNGRV